MSSSNYCDTTGWVIGLCCETTGWVIGLCCDTTGCVALSPPPLRLLGVCADEDPVYIVMEFMPGGALLEFLRKKGSHQTKKKLCLMCVDACRVSQGRGDGTTKISFF